MAKAKDAIERARIVAQQRQLGQGALFIIDNPGSFPSEGDLVAFINSKTKQHLSKHTYYQQEKGIAGLGNRIRVDVPRMRKYIADLGRKTSKGAISVEALFRGSSDKIKAEVKKTYGYNKDTFSEADLPGYEEEEKVATKSASKSPSWVMADTSPPHSPQVLLPGPAKRALDLLDESQHRQRKRPRNSISTANESHQPPSFILPHSCENCFIDRKFCDRQWPCTRCTAKGFGVERCIGRHEDRERTMANTAGETVQPWGIEADQTKRSGMDVSRSDDGERSDMIYGRVGQVYTAADLGKEQDAQMEFSEEHRVLDLNSSPQGSLERPAQGDSAKPRPDEGQPERPVPAFGAVTLDLSETTSTQVQTDGVARVGQPVLSDSTQATTSQNSHRPKDAQQMHQIDIKVLGKQLVGIQRDLVEAVRSLLECIGDIRNQTCPLELEPSDRLSALYARCLGPDWANVAREYNSYNAFKAPQATMSLMSAFLYDNILVQQAYDPGVIEEVMELLQARGITGRAAQAVFDVPNREKDVFESASNIATEEARAALAQDATTLQLKLQTEAEDHMEALWHVLAPHFRNQSQVAQSLHLSSGRSDAEVDTELLKIFKKAITALIYKTLHHKKQLIATGCEYSYVWPSNGDEVDENEMVEFGASMHEPLVRYTVFPGLKVNLPTSHRNPGDPIRSLIMTKHARYR